MSGRDVSNKAGLRYVRLLGILAIAAVIFLYDDVWSILPKKVQYIPGMERVIEEVFPQERYILQEPVSFMIDEIDVVIIGIVSDNKSTYVTMSGNGYWRDESIQLQSEPGVKYTLEAAGATSSSGEWTQSYRYEGKLELGERVSIIIGGDQETIIPITLEKAETFSRIEEMGANAVAGDISITAAVRQLGDRMRIALIPQHDENLQIREYGLSGNRAGEKISVIDNTGEEHKPENYIGAWSPVREYYFSLSDRAEVNRYTFLIPELSAAYKDSVRMKLDVPAAGETVPLGKAFVLAGFPVEITKLEHAEGNHLRIYVDTHYDEQAPKALRGFRLDSMSYSASYSKPGAAMEYIEFGIAPEAESVRVTFTEPEVIIRGPWRFELPVKGPRH